MRQSNSKKFVKLIFLTIACMSFFKVKAQFIFSAKDLNTFCEQAVIEDVGGDFSFTVRYFRENGYNRVENTDDFQDKYGNKISILVASSLMPGVYSLDYHIKKPNATIIKNYQNELKDFFSFNYRGKTSYLIDDQWIINFENKPGIEYILSFYRNAKGGAFIPAKKIDNTHLEVSSYRNGTNVAVKQGDKVYLKASGSVVLGAWAGSGGPDGINGFESYSKESEFKHGALLCYIDDNKTYGKPLIKVGSYCTFTATRNGNLRFVINDNDPSNNSGSFLVEYSINKEIKPSEILEEPKVTENIQPPINNNPTKEIQKPLVDNSPKIVLEDYFVDNTNNWGAASDKHILNIGGNRMTYENKEKDERVYSMVGIPISLVNDDNYTVEASIQSLTPCQNQQVNNLISLVSKKPKPVFYGFAIGNKETDILFAVGSNIQSRETRDNINYTCNPSYFITSLISGNSNYLQDWTKNYSIADGSNVNILKLIKLNGRFTFYVNNRLVSTKNSYPLGNDNAISIVSSAKSKMSVNYVKIYKN